MLPIVGRATCIPSCRTSPKRTRSMTMMTMTAVRGRMVASLRRDPRPLPAGAHWPRRPRRHIYHAYPKRFTRPFCLQTQLHSHTADRREPSAGSHSLSDGYAPSPARHQRSSARTPPLRPTVRREQHHTPAHAQAAPGLGPPTPASATQAPIPPTATTGSAAPISLTAETRASSTGTERRRHSWAPRAQAGPHPAPRRRVRTAAVLAGDSQRRGR
jgi:hypothetical protein